MRKAAPAARRAGPGFPVVMPTTDNPAATAAPKPAGESCNRTSGSISGIEYHKFSKPFQVRVPDQP